MHLVRVLQPFRAYLNASAQGVFADPQSPASIQLVQQERLASASTFAGVNKNERAGTVWGRITKELDPQRYLKFSAFRHWMILMMDFVFNDLYRRTEQGKAHVAFVTLRNAAAEGEGHSVQVKAKWYTREQELRDIFTTKPCQVLMFAAGLGKSRRQAIEQVEPPGVAGVPAAAAAAAGQVGVLGGRPLELVPRETVETRFRKKQPEIREALRKHLQLPDVLSPEQGQALALCWYSSTVLFRQVMLPTGSGKTAVVVLPLLANPDRRALVIVSMSRAQLESTAKDIEQLAQHRIRVFILRPNSIQAIEEQLSSFRDTGVLPFRVVFLICIESLDELQHPGARRINQLIQDLSQAGLIDQIVSDESHSFDLSPSVSQGRTALFRFFTWLPMILVDRQNHFRAPHTRLTGTPGSEANQLEYWKAAFPRQFAGNPANAFRAYVQTVQTDPCRTNVTLDVENWDTIEEQVKELVRNQDVPLCDQPEDIAICGYIFVERMKSLGIAVFNDDHQLIELSCNVLVCIPSVRMVVGLMLYFQGRGLPERFIFGDWASNDLREGSDGLQLFRVAKNAVCFSTTRFVASSLMPGHWSLITKQTWTMFLLPLSFSTNRFSS